MYSLYSDIIHPICLTRINCTICLKYFVTGTNNFIVQFLKKFWFSLKQRLVIKAASQRLCMVPQTDNRYLNKVHSESKSWHICIVSH